MQQKAAINSQKANQIYELGRNPDLIKVQSRAMLSIEALRSLRKKGRSRDGFPTMLSVCFTQVLAITRGECYLNVNNKRQPQPKNENGKKAKAKTTTRQVEVQVAAMELRMCLSHRCLQSPEEGACAASRRRCHIYVD
jgi:hypothetical protein